ncbi:MAG: hypothetical protein ABI880_09815 [Acidobacteriota bacterium]
MATSVGVVLALAASGRAAQDSAKPSPRPADVIALARLIPDARIAVTLAPGAVASDDGIWVSAGSSLVRIDAKTNVTGTPVSVPSPVCASLVVAFDSVWAPLCAAGTVARVDVKTMAVTAPLTLGVADAAGRIDTAVGSVWIASDAKGVVARVDPDTNDVVAEIVVARRPSAVAAGDQALWVTSAEGDLLTRVDPHTNVVVDTVKVGLRPGRVAVGEGGVWTLNRGDGSVTRVDPATTKVVATIAVEGAAQGEIAVGAGSVWVSAPGLPLVRIDPRTNRAAQRFTGAGGGAVLVAHGSVWIAAGPALTWRLDPTLVAATRPE